MICLLDHCIVVFNYWVSKGGRISLVLEIGSDDRKAFLQVQSRAINLSLFIICVLGVRRY